MSHRTAPACPGKPGRLITLWHSTPCGRVRSILRGGLLPALSQCARAEVWLCSASRRPWSLAHTRERHGVEAVALVRVVVPRAWLVRRRRGLWTCTRPIGPERIVAIRPPVFAA